MTYRKNPGMRKALKASASSAALTMAMLLSASQANAQTAETSGVQTIVITAEHRSENIQNAPVAIDAVSGSDLKDAGVTNLQQLTQQLPAVQFARAGGPFALFFLRGVGSFAANSLTDSAVQVSINGVPVARQYGTGGQMYDLDRVEVLKGPQGTLNGSNATGGAVNIISARPDFTDEGNVGVAFGNYSAIQTNGMYNVALSDKAAIRGAFQTIRHSGYLSDGQDDEDDQAARLQLRYDSNSNLTFNLTGDIYHQGGEGGGSVLLDGYSASDRVGLTDPRSQAYYTTRPCFLTGGCPGGGNTAPQTSQLHIDGTYGGVKGGLDWTTPLGVTTVVTGYRKNDVDSVGISGPLLTDTEHDHQKSVEAREAFDPFYGFQLTVGAYALEDNVRGSFQVNNFYYATHQNVAGAGNTQAFVLKTTSRAVYADATLNLTDSFRLIGGARFSEDEKTLNGTLTTFAPPSPINPVSFVPGTTAHDPSTWNSKTWRAGAQWNITDKSMAYATVSTGFHSGGFFLTHDNPSFQPETIKAYTVGVKNRFFDDQLQVNLEAFLWLYKNQQLSAVTFDSTFSTVFKTFNAASSHIKGAELSVDYLPATNTLLTAKLQYLDSAFRNFNFQEAAFAFSATSKCTGTPAGAFENVNCTGLQLPNSPKWTINLGAQQTFPLHDGSSIVAGIHEHYQGSTFLAVSYLPTDLQPSYWMGDLVLSYELPGKGWGVTAFVNNFTDETVKYSTNHAVAQIDTAQLAAPRTYGIRISKDF